MTRINMCRLAVNLAVNFSTVQVDVISLPKGPEISGLKTTYSAGDLVRANCSAYGSLPPVSLMWYINKVQLLDKLVSTSCERLSKYYFLFYSRPFLLFCNSYGVKLHYLFGAVQSYTYQWYIYKKVDYVSYKNLICWYSNMVVQKDWHIPSKTV